MTKNLKLLTSALFIGANVYLHPCLSSDLIEESSILSHSGKILENRSKEVLTLEISNPVKEQFENFVRSKNYSYEDVYENPDLVMQIMGQKLKEILPSDTQQTLKEMGQKGTPGILYLKGLPIDSYVPLEENVLERVVKKGKVSESLILGMTNLMGCKVRANPKEQEGRIIHNIAPVRGYEETKSSKGRDPFYLHTENPFEQSPPDFLILCGLEGDPNAKTSCFFIEKMIETFPEWVLKGMKKREFHIHSGQGLDQREEGIFSLISEENNKKLRLRLYQEMERIHATTQESKEVLDYISINISKDRIIIHPQYQEISINLGEALIINNGWGIDKISGVMHGRSGYIKNPNRWLQRAFLFRNNEN